MAKVKDLTVKFLLPAYIPPKIKSPGKVNGVAEVFIFRLHVSYVNRIFR